MTDDGRSTLRCGTRARLAGALLLIVAALTAGCSQEGPPPGFNVVAPELPPPPPVVDSIAFVTSSLPSGEEDEPYRATIESRGGADSLHTFAVIEGRLPQGLVLETSTGPRVTTIHGTPTRDESRNFTIIVRDGSANSATRRFRIRIDEGDDD